MTRNYLLFSFVAQSHMTEKNHDCNTVAFDVHTECGLFTDAFSPISNVIANCRCYQDHFCCILFFVPRTVRRIALKFQDALDVIDIEFFFLVCCDIFDELKTREVFWQCFFGLSFFVKPKKTFLVENYEKMTSSKSHLNRAKRVRLSKLRGTHTL